MASTILLAATRRHLQCWGRTRHQSELAHTWLHLVFGMENTHPDCSGAAESWLAQVHDNMGVDGDGLVQFDMIHAWEMRCWILLRL